jgi:hypothetical protein
MTEADTLDMAQNRLVVRRQIASRSDYNFLDHIKAGQSFRGPKG